MGKTANTKTTKTKTAKTTATQHQRLLSYLAKKPGTTSVTVNEARTRFGITNPRARICELRANGHSIETTMRMGKDGVRRGHYTLSKLD
jgi:hypothetical protein